MIGLVKDLCMVNDKNNFFKKIIEKCENRISENNKNAWAFQNNPFLIHSCLDFDTYRYVDTNLYYALLELDLSSYHN